MSFWRTVRIHLEMSYQSTVLNSLLRAEFLDFAHRSLYKMPTIKFEISIVKRQQYVFRTLLSHYTLSYIRRYPLAIFFISELKPLPLMTQKSTGCPT